MEFSRGLKEYIVSIDDLKINLFYKNNPSASDIIIFLHGLACSSDSFRNLYDKDYFAGFSLLVPDLPGFGKSAKPESFSYKMEDQAQIIQKLLSLFHETKYHIVAHSMGSAIGLLFQNNFYNNVITFSNIEGNLIGEDCGLLSRGIIEHSYENYKDHMFRKQQFLFSKHSQLRFNQTSPLAVYKSAESLVYWSDSGLLLENFRKINCRKSYFYGEENIGMPVLNKLDFVVKYMITKSGHGMMTDNPKEFYTKLENFITGK